MTDLATVLGAVRWPRELHVHKDVNLVREHAAEWTHRTGLGERSVMIDTPWLAAVTYPTAEPDLLLTAHDWMAWLIAFDDTVDDTELGRDVDRVRSTTTALLAVADGRAAPKDSAIQVALADVWSRLRAAAPRQWLAMFRTHVLEYFDSYLWETGNRTVHAVPQVAEYLRNRLDTGAVQTCFDLTMLCCPAVPWESGGEPSAFRTEPVAKVEKAASRVISLTNDIASYAKERSNGDFHNLVAILVEAEGMEHDQASAAVVARIIEGIDEFEATVGRAGFDTGTAVWLPGYVDGLRSWMTGNFHWSARTRRFAS
jgi:hypothetical protein